MLLLFYKMKKTFGYYAISNSDEFVGINKKIIQFVDSINDIGNIVGYFRRVSPGVTSSIRLAAFVSAAQEDVVYIRGNSYALLITFFGMMIARFRGKKIILEIPTPQIAVSKEIFLSNSNLIVKFAKLIGLYASGSWSFIPAHKIIQYGVEGFWFSCLSNKKFFLMGNGCNVDKIPKIYLKPDWPSDFIKIVMVANFSKTHGADLLIKAISILNKKSNKFYYLSLIGDGEVVSELKGLVKDSKQEEFIDFHGPLYGEKLLEQYQKAHIAVGALALHRIGLNLASALKLREYCAIGIPFFFTGIDPDFPSGLSFANAIPSKESPDEIVKLLEDFSLKSCLPSSEEIRNYALQNLDFKVKIGKILENLMC